MKIYPSIIIASLSFAVSAPALADHTIEGKDVAFYQSVPSIEKTCQIDGHSVALSFRNAPGTSAKPRTENSSSPLVYLKTKTPHELERLSESHTGLFQSGGIYEDSTCKEFNVFDIGDHNYALLYQHEDSPSIRHTIATVWNSQTDEVLHQEDLGALSKVYKAGTGFAYSLTDKQEGSSGKIKVPGVGEQSAIRKDLGALKTFTWKDKQVQSEYDPVLSYRKSEWKQYFKNQNDFLSAAGWDKLHHVFKNTIVYETLKNPNQTDAEQRNCIQMSSMLRIKASKNVVRCETTRM